MKTLLWLCLPVALTGCAALSDARVEMDPPPVVQLPDLPQAQPRNGAIFNANTYRPLFEQHRARLVGDTLMISIVEKISASQSSTSEADRSGSLSGEISGLPGLDAAKVLGRASVGAKSGNKTTGKGSNQNSNEFTGTVTAIVQAVLPNGHLLITAEKQIGVNNNVDVLRFSGQVDPRAIGAGNVVDSTSVANVRIEQRGRGPAEGLHGIGWLSRFFLSLSPT
ncbi:flagellar basal body L-ring protein FlgH [Inhella gelatinilytica]|uniref:Flagellar L-ring protein n=1 Tax=Inhella gelatinilytica TaxID=2795030 RepID=A0A931IYW9_9BURK|nr:flagellar basal body L-ring protein FlgH [Inhella gelatinilytica]MBH9553545.1 flagellar basal body L-ring protein FlgH [Inhella gelatinilytica]